MTMFLEIVNTLSSMAGVNVIAFDVFGNPLTVAEIEPLTEVATASVVSYLSTIKNSKTKIEILRTVNGVQMWNLLVENRVIQFVFSN